MIITICQGRQRRDASAAREGQLGRNSAVKSQYYWLYVNTGKSILAAIYLRRIRVAGRIFAAAPTQVSTVVTPPVPAAKNSAWASGGPAGGRRVA